MRKYTAVHLQFLSVRSEDVESPTIVGAQAANELLNIIGIKASFCADRVRRKKYTSVRVPLMRSMYS